MGATDALIGSSGLVVGVYFLDDGSVFGCPSESAVHDLYAPAWVVGGAVGAGTATWILGRAGTSPTRRGDWTRALAGIAAGSVAGAVRTASVPGVGEPDGPLWPILAAPVLQGIGAGVAVGMRR